MKPFIWLLSVIWGTGLAAGTGLSGGPIETQAKENQPMLEKLLNLEKGAMERWRNGDPWGWAEISAPDVTYIDPGLTQPIVGLSAYKTYLKQLEKKVFYQKSEFIDPQVVVVGDAALLTYNYRSTATAGDPPHTTQTLWNTTEVYFRRGGEFKIVHTHWSFVNHQLPPSLEIPLPVQMSVQTPDGLRSELLALETGAMERWRNGDPFGFTDISGPFVTYFDSGTPRRINGREALIAHYTPIKGQVHFDVMDFIEPRVQSLGDMAVLTYRFLSTRLKPDGSVAKRTPWHCTEVFARIDGKWKIIHTHWSHIRGEKSEKGS